MKTTILKRRSLFDYIRQGGLALAIMTAGPSFADESTNAAVGVANAAAPAAQPSPSQNEMNVFGLPKSAVDRMSPEQLIELARVNQQHTENWDKGILVPISLFAMVPAIVGLVVFARLKRQRMLYETVRMMVEKGQPIPPDLLQPEESKPRPRSDLRRGLICVGVGIGLVVLLLVRWSSIWPVALIPLLIGVAFLITWKLESNKNGQSQ